MGAVQRFWSLYKDTIASLALEGCAQGPGGGTAAMTPSIEAGTGPYGENVLKLVATTGSVTSGVYYSLPVPTSSTTFSIGCYVKAAALQTSQYLIKLITASASNNFTLMTHATTPGKLIALNYTTSVCGPSTYTYSAGGWFHVQLDVYCASGTSGYVKVRINGAEDMNATGLNTGTYAVSGIYLGQPAAVNQTISYANIWTALGGYKGECIARGYTVTGDDSVTLTPSTGGSNYALLDESGNDAADYVHADASTLPKTDTYTTENMTDTPEQMIAFGVKAFGKKTDTAPVVMRAVAKPSGGSDDLSDTNVALSTSTSGTQFIWETHPDNSTGALTGMTGANAKTMFDGCTFGVKLAGS